MGGPDSVRTFQGTACQHPKDGLRCCFGRADSSACGLRMTRTIAEVVSWRVILAGGSPMRLQVIILLSFVTCACLLSAEAFAQNPPAQSTPEAVASPTPSAAPTTVYTLPPDKLEKSKALYDVRVKMRLVGTVWSFLVLLGILYLGIAARYRDWAEWASKYSFLQALIVVPLLLLTIDVLSLPLDAYQQSISRRYGLSVQGWGSWFWDQ